MLGERVRVILDAGPTPGPLASTIVDCTTDEGRVLRQGVIPLERLNEIVSAYDTEIVDEG
jgi:tRNA A37 threonylcarbamoyladenosine synthetase subunit TsaC/SUA5/YrdC